MRVRSSVWRLCVAVFGAALVSCGGGGGGSTSAVPQPEPQGNVQIPQGGGSVRLPDTAGIASTLIVDANTDDPPFGVNATTSTTIPSQYGISGDASGRVPETTTPARTPVWYLFFIPLKTVTLPGLPALEIDLPRGLTGAGKAFYLAYYDGTKWNYEYEGPATVRGDDLFFPATHTPVTWLRGVLYGYEVYWIPLHNPIAVSPSSLSLTPGQSKTFQISETGYTGTFTVGTCKSGATTIANVAGGSAHGPTVTITVTGVASGSCTIAISDSYGQTASESVTVASVVQPPLTVTPPTLTLNGSTPGHFTAAETGYTGPFTIGTCTQSSQTIATASPTTANGPSAVITVTPVKAGSCTIVVSDNHGKTASVSVTVSTSTLSISPTALQFATAPSAQTQSVTISETGYAGAFTYTPCKQGSTTVATLTPASISGPSATLTVTSQAVGNCTVMVSDSFGQSGTFTVGAASANITVNSVKRR
jgi:hypothetical protein